MLAVGSTARFEGKGGAVPVGPQAAARGAVYPRLAVPSIRGQARLRLERARKICDRPSPTPAICATVFNKADLLPVGLSLCSCFMRTPTSVDLDQGRKNSPRPTESPEARDLA